MDNTNRHSPSGVFMALIGLCAFALLSAILGKLPGVLWQDFVRYALVTAYITGVHPAIMRGVAQHVHDAKRA